MYQDIFSAKLWNCLPLKNLGNLLLIQKQSARNKIGRGKVCLLLLTFSISELYEKETNEINNLTLNLLQKFHFHDIAY